MSPSSLDERGGALPLREEKIYMYIYTHIVVPQGKGDPSLSSREGGTHPPSPEGEGDESLLLSRRIYVHTYTYICICILIYVYK